MTQPGESLGLDEYLVANAGRLTYIVETSSSAIDSLGGITTVGINHDTETEVHTKLDVAYFIDNGIDDYETAEELRRIEVERCAALARNAAFQLAAKATMHRVTALLAEGLMNLSASPSLDHFDTATWRYQTLNDDEFGDLELETTHLGGLPHLDTADLVTIKYTKDDFIEYSLTITRLGNKVVGAHKEINPAQDDPLFIAMHSQLEPDDASEVLSHLMTSYFSGNSQPENFINLLSKIQQKYSSIIGAKRIDDLIENIQQRVHHIQASRDLRAQMTDLNRPSTTELQAIIDFLGRNF